jgi:hypothetical protein
MSVGMNMMPITIWSITRILMDMSVGRNTILTAIRFIPRILMDMSSGSTQRGI